MTNITLSIDEKLKGKMEQFPEINWSAVVRRLLEEKTKQLEIREHLKKEFKEESALTTWTIDMGRKTNQGIAERLRKEGYIK
ncbi:MAG: hypothetical protein AABX35_04305 [Nanoarchaeota archaeon]|mgnify:CR=1 FL=1